MRRKKAKPNYRRIILRLPDLDHSRLAVLNSLTSPNSRRVYQYALERFIAWYCSEPRLAFNRIVVVRYRNPPGVLLFGSKHDQIAPSSRSAPGP